MAVNGLGPVIWTGSHVAGCTSLGRRRGLGLGFLLSYFEL